MADWSCVGSQEISLVYGDGTTPSNTANTKGSWTIQATLNHSVDGFWINWSWMQTNGTARTLLCDVSVDDVVIASNLAICPGGRNGANDSRAHSGNTYFPITLPPGVVKTRAQCSVASHGIVYFMLNMSPGIGLNTAGAQMTAYGVDTQNTKGTVVTASNTEGVYGSWVQISASCNRISALMAHVGHNNAWLSGLTDQWYRIRVGIGEVGSEHIIWVPYETGGSSSTTGLHHNQWHGPIYVDIPAGTRLAVCGAAQNSSGVQRVRDVILYGIS